MSFRVKTKSSVSISLMARGANSLRCYLLSRSHNTLCSSNLWSRLYGLSCRNRSGFDLLCWCFALACKQIFTSLSVCGVCVVFVVVSRRVSSPPPFMSPLSVIWVMNFDREVIRQTSCYTYVIEDEDSALARLNVFEVRLSPNCITFFDFTQESIFIDVGSLLHKHIIKWGVFM